MFDPCFEHWQVHRWVNAHSRRYYEARVLKNLLGDWEVFCVWGGLGSRLGGTSVITALSLADTGDIVLKLHAKRLKRHYCRVDP